MSLCLDWKEHKRSACVKPEIFHRGDKLEKKYSRPGYPMSNLNYMEELLWKSRRKNPKPVSACDGCYKRFIGFPKTKGGYFEGEDNKDPVAKCKRCNV